MKTELTVLFLLFSLALTSARADPVQRPAGTEVGTNFIQNHFARIELGNRPLAYMHYSRWNETDNKWEEFFNGGLLGDIQPQAMMLEYRGKYKGWYFLFEKTVPTAVRTRNANGTAIMEFKTVAADTNLWMETALVLFTNSPLVLVRTANSSIAGLRSFWYQAQSRGCPYIVVENARQIAAADCPTNKPLFAKFLKYDFNYHPDDDHVYGLLCPVKDNIKMQSVFYDRFHSKTNAARSAYIAYAPHVLYGGYLPGKSRNVQDISRLADDQYAAMFGALAGAGLKCDEERSVAAADEIPPPVARVPVIKEIDPAGNLLKIDWSKALVIDKWSTLMGKASSRSMRAFLMHDGRCLYVCLEDMGVADKLQCDPQIWQGDDWELFIAAKRGTLPYRQIGINPDGQYKELAYGENSTKLAYGENSTKWDSGARVSSARENGRWKVIVALPLVKIIPGGITSGGSLFANFIRGIPSPGEPAAWSPVYGSDFHAVNRLGELKLE